MINEFVKKIVSLDNIHQWAERDSVIKESVSQHCFKVASFAIFILENLEKTNPDYVKNNTKWMNFSRQCIEYAVIHDFDEAIIGRDISHVVKYNKHNGEDIRKNLNDYVHYEVERIGINFINSEISNDVKMFVKMCDWLAMLSFIHRNERMGVKTFVKEKNYCKREAELMICGTKVMLEKKFLFDSFECLNDINQQYVYGDGDL